MAVLKRADFRFIQLREITCKPVVEKAHVFDTACGGEFLQDWQFDARDARVCHRKS
jgi:hypothetical protein